MVHIYLLIDWFVLGWALTVPMHLSLTDRPFVPHNLISAQECPVPLPKYQMAPKLKILMSSGSKKGIHIYYLFLSESPSQWIPSMFHHWGPRGERCLLTGHFYISLNISSLSQRPQEKSIPPCSPKVVPLGKQMPIPEPYLTCFLGSPVKESSLQVPLMESTRREMPHS